VASRAKDAANKVADAAPSKDNFLGGVLNKAPDAADVKGAVGDASSAAKDALPSSGEHHWILTTYLFLGSSRCIFVM